MGYQLLELRKFLSRIERDINTETPIPFTWLIGAGFSQSAGIPLAKEVSHIIVLYEYIGDVRADDFEDELIGFGYDQKQLKSYLDWYYELKKTNNKRYNELIDQAYSWLKTTENFENIDRESPNCYQKLFTHLLRYKNDHHYFLTSIIQRVRGINVAHIGLAGLLKDYPKWGDTVYTTNFDDLLLTSILSLNHTARIFGEVESSEQPSQSPSYPQIVHLHGRHTGYNLLNTKEEVEKWYNQELKKAFEKHISDSSLIVIGYSGWDDMIMQTLKEWNDSNPNLIRGNLYWIPYLGEQNIDKKAIKFLNNCPKLKTFVIVNSDPDLQLNADSFILSLCNSINKKNGRFAKYRSDLLNTAKEQHKFIMYQLVDYPDHNPQTAYDLALKAEERISKAELSKSISLLEEAYEIIIQPDISSELKAKVGKKLGLSYYKLDRLKESKKLLEFALSHFTQLPQKNEEIQFDIAETKRILAEILISKDEFNEALEHIKNSMFLSITASFEHTFLKWKRNHLLCNLTKCFIYLLKGRYEHAESLLNQVDKEIEIVMDEPKILGKICQIKSCYFLVTDRISKAKHFLNESDSHFSNIEDSVNKFLNNIYHAEIFVKENNLKKVNEKINCIVLPNKDEIAKGILLNNQAYIEMLENNDNRFLIEKLLKESTNLLSKNESNYNLINVLTDCYVFYRNNNDDFNFQHIKEQIKLTNCKPHQYFKAMKTIEKKEK
ncbi:hypothetical protein AWE51_02890 [Aquimarina aggregata]|uniref:Uncharacterized protein n=1 Tax=Aquimarina aggregata TaxID=1642818 RepID=A0A163CH42_9FLAO|nr:SIR2 family protein [Aquimarina aggregata]KZS42405.1 hypothetical protein AWE51_02890 [Aquimarina aggregata]